MTSYAYVRTRQLPFASLGNATRHARGDARRRDDADDTRAVVAKRSADHPANDYVALYKAHKRRHGASEYGKYAPVRHLLVGVSPTALGGDGHDPQSTAVRRLLTAAREWPSASSAALYASSRCYRASARNLEDA